MKRIFWLFLFLTGCQLLPRPAAQPVPTPILPASLPQLPMAVPQTQPLPTAVPQPSLEIHLTGQIIDNISTANPAQAAYQIVGRDIAEVVQVAGRSAEDGRQQVLAWEKLPGPWPDGVHEGQILWSPQVVYLSDSAGNGDFVLSQPEDGGLTAVSGQFIFADGGQTANAVLLFDTATNQLTQIQAEVEIRPRLGDQFQLEQCFYLDGLACEAGTVLQFDENSQIQFSPQPLPDGRYAFGIFVSGNAAASTEAFTGLTVSGNRLAAGQLYRSPGLDYQFIYPQNWLSPRPENGGVTISNRSGTARIQLTLLPQRPRQETAVSLQQETLARFGPVDILHEGERLVGGMKALETAYGYTDETGQEHAGVFYTFLDNAGNGYLLDVDGLEADEAALVQTAVTLADSWQFLAPKTGPGPDWWLPAEFSGVTLAHPPNFTAQPAGDWLRFSAGPQTFLALRFLPVNDAAEAVKELAEEAGRGMNNFQSSLPTAAALGGEIWQRSDFSYQSGDGRPISGFLMVRRADEELLAAWAEAPAAQFPQMDTAVFLTMLADIE